MGLDIYFYANEKAEADNNRITASQMDTKSDGDVNIEVGYFRKVNALFAWVEDHVGAIENCEKLLVTQAHLLVLQRDLQALTPENCQAVFPTRAGFFFGSTDYDDGYWADVDDMKNWLEEMIDTFEFDRFSLHFVAWW